MKEFKIALFDLDGTLLDTESQYSVFWGRMGEQYRPDVPGLSDIIKGTTLTQIFDRFFPDPQWQQQIVKELNEWESHMQYPFFPGAETFVNDLRAHGVKTAVVTSSNEKKMESVRRQKPSLDQLFDRILTAEMFRASKPAPDCYLQAAAAFGAKTEECVVFEDALTGLEAGMRAGMFTVGLATTNPLDVIQSRCSLAVTGFDAISYQLINSLLVG